MIFCLFYSFVFISYFPLESALLVNRGYYVLVIQEQYLGHSRHLVNICGIREQLT